MTSSSPTPRTGAAGSLNGALQAIGHGIEQVSWIYLPRKNPSFKAYPGSTKTASYQTAVAAWFLTGSFATGLVLGLAGQHSPWSASNPAEIGNLNRIGYQVGGAIGGKSRGAIQHGVVKVEDWNAMNEQNRQQKSAGRSATR